MDVVIDAAEDHHHICCGIHIISAATEAKVIAGRIAGVDLVGQSAAADAIAIDGAQLAHIRQTVIITVALVYNACTFGNAVAQEIHFQALDIHMYSLHLRYFHHITKCPQYQGQSGWIFLL